MERLEKLALWRGRYDAAAAAYASELARMDRREELYAGTRTIAGAGWVKPATLVRNVAAELVESQVSSFLPRPKVTALRPGDEEKARVIEDLLRNLLDLLPTEYLNDSQERTTYIQGGALTLVEWDNLSRIGGGVGQVKLSDLHPKKVIPQPGVFADAEEMDYLFVVLPQTQASLLRRYGAVVPGAEDDAVVTQVIAYYRNPQGGVGLFSWAGDTVLADWEDCQARRLARCTACGEPVTGEVCPLCGGGEAEEAGEAFETLAADVTRSDGTVIPAVRGGEATRLPYYRPRLFPVVLRRNVSVFGRFLGDSDVDKIEGQQEALKKLDSMILEKLLKGGSVLTLPRDAEVDLTDEQLRILRLDGPQDKGMIDVYNLQPDITGDLTYAEGLYEQARQMIGITDSYQGRQDPTATSGVAKQFAAQQSAGRLESKRAMKDAAWARIFEVIFKFLLAYADEPRVSARGAGWSTFNRYDFLEQDAAGRWVWNDNFAFGTDAAAALASDREAMWSETRENLTLGCYGNPDKAETLMVFWTRMEELGYPNAAAMKQWFSEQRERTAAQDCASQNESNGKGESA